MDETKESTMRGKMLLIAAGVVAAVALAACASSPNAATSSTVPATTSGSSQSLTPASPTEAPVPSESPVPVESNPPGDIPDNIAFVPYHSPKGGWAVSVPEGWSRTSAGTTVTFTDKLNTVQVDELAAAPETTAEVKKTDVPALAASARAFKLRSVTEVSLPAGPAVLISYEANSDPNPVTGKQYRLDVLEYLVFHAGMRTTLTLLSPIGSDNVDPWRIVTESLKVP